MHSLREKGRGYILSEHRTLKQSSKEKAIIILNQIIQSHVINFSSA